MTKPEKKFLFNDMDHTRKTHYRWIEKTERHEMPPKNENEVSMERCFMCQYYIKLRGTMGADWGVCSNPSSEFDSMLTYEEDGCKQFSYAADEDSF